MEQYCHLLDYFIKDLSPDDQRGIYGELRDNFTSRQRDIIFDSRNGYKNTLKKGSIFRSVEEIEMFLSGTADDFIAINNRMISRGRAPLFEDPYDLVQSMEWRDRLLTFTTERECNAFLGCRSFEEYVPPVYQKE